MMNPMIAPLIDIGEIMSGGQATSQKGKPVQRKIAQPQEESSPAIIVNGTRPTSDAGSRLPPAAPPLVTVTPEQLQPMPAVAIPGIKPGEIPPADIVMPDHPTVNQSAPPLGGHRNLLDVVAGLIVGNTPETQLSPTEQRATQQRRQNASQGAVEAYNNPGEGFMGPPVLSGKSSLFDNLTTLFQTVTRL